MGISHRTLQQVDTMKSTFNYQHVLVVEDDYLLALDICDQLQETGARVIGPAPSLDVALNLLDHPPWPEVAILDINLADGKVYPLAKKLIERGIPFVFASSVTPDEIPEYFAAVPLIGKPLELARLPLLT